MKTIDAKYEQAKLELITDIRKLATNQISVSRFGEIHGDKVLDAVFIKLFKARY